MKRPAILLRIVATCLLPGLLIGASFSSCKREPMEARDPALYALDIKTQVVEFLNDAKANPQNGRLYLSDRSRKIDMLR